MIFPRTPQTTQAVARHYDELDRFYRDIWGEHLHHGYWATGRETSAQAVEALVELLADRLSLAPHQTICDIGCGYGASARQLAERFDLAVTGLTVSCAQARLAASRTTTRGTLSVRVQDWLTNDLAENAFDRAYAIESSEHMADKQKFFDEAWRTLRPGGRLAVFAWLAGDDPRPWEIRHLLEPICREGRLPSMGDEADYRRMAQRSGFSVTSVDDFSRNVRRTWTVCGRRVLAKLVVDPRYVRFLLDRSTSNRVFALTLLRLLIAYRTGSMRYCLMMFQRGAA